MAGLVDLHSHVLPQVDDGAASLEMALEMLRHGLEEGIAAALLTPHIEPEDGAEKEALHRERFAAFKEEVERAELPVELHLGAELAFRFGLAEIAGWPSGTLAETGQYALVDLPFGPLPTGMEQGFFELRTAGFKPILAHPERYRNLVREPERLQRLRQQDLLFQVNAGSLTGRFGRRAQQTAEMLLARGWVEFVASDGHDLEKRPFSLAAAYARVQTLCSEAAARRLFCENPRRVIRGEPVEAAPISTRQKRRRPGLLQRLFGGEKSQTEG